MTTSNDTALSDAIGRLATTPHLLVALDFDGTLAPEVDAPLAARALPEAHAAILRMLDLPNTSVALVSGRALDSLSAVADLPPGVMLVGSHGVEVRIGGSDEVVLSPEEQALRARVSTILYECAAPYDDISVEEKPAGLALHTRLADAATTEAVQAEVRRRIAAETTGVTERVGKNVLEFAVRSVSKGDAVDHLRDVTGATAVFYAGDDVTDEDAFVALTADDLGVKSGEGPTAADHRVGGVKEIASVLSLLATLRETHMSDGPDTN